MESKLSRRDFLTRSALALSAGTVSSPPWSASLTNPVSMIKPAKLRKGDTIGVIAPAAAFFKDHQLDDFLVKLTELGFRHKVGKHVRDKYGYLAGKDQDRLSDIHQMFEDPEVDAIIAIRGGYGCARLIDQLDYELIKNHPKIICGYSDLTALLNAITVKTGLVTFHGPVGVSQWTDFTLKYFEKVLMRSSRVNFNDFEGDDQPVTITSGKAEGVLFGGNLSVLSNIVGSDYLPDWRGKILFLEEVSEKVFRIDRMLVQLKLAGILDQISGFVFGKCDDCEPEEPEKSLSLEQVFDDIIRPLGIPAFHGTMIGHIENKYTMPIGVKAEINADKCAIQLLDSPTD